MIVDAILSFFYSIAIALLDLAPDIPIPDISGWVASISVVWEHLAWANNFVPVDQILLCIGLVVSFYIALAAVRFVVWVSSKAHVLGGGSN